MCLHLQNWQVGQGHHIQRAQPESVSTFCVPDLRQPKNLPPASMTSSPPHWKNIPTVRLKRQRAILGRIWHIQWDQTVSILYPKRIQVHVCIRVPDLSQYKSYHSFDYTIFPALWFRLSLCATGKADFFGEKTQSSHPHYLYLVQDSVNACNQPKYLSNLFSLDTLFVTRDNSCTL